jgi:phosphoglycerate dehydrogenase-like enzyme
MIPFLIESGDCSTTHVLAEFDYLLLLLPSTTETRGILDRAALALLKPGGTRSWQVSRTSRT